MTQPKRSFFYVMLALSLTISCSPVGAWRAINEPGLYENQISQSEIDNIKTNARLRYDFGNELYKQGLLQGALESYSSALNILDPIDDDELKSEILLKLGNVYQGLHRYPNAVEVFKMVVKLRQDADCGSLANGYGSLGSAYMYQGNYGKALQAYLEGLNKASQCDSHNSILLSNLHTDIGMVKAELAEYAKAFEHFDTALELLGYSGDDKTEGRTLHHIGYTYWKRGAQENNPEDIEKSVEVYKQAVLLRRSSDDIDGEGKTLNSLGFSYAQLGRYEKALETLSHALVIARDQSDIDNEGRTLDSIATVYLLNGDSLQAIDYLYEALLIAQEIGDRGAEHVTLANLGKVFLQQNRPQLAVVFFKKSVQIVEEIRKELLNLPAVTQDSYVKSVSEVYRLLANLLLQQYRSIEAEQVLDLLRIEELSGYLGRVRGNGGQLYLLPAEEKVLKLYYAALLDVGDRMRELRQLEKIPLNEIAKKPELKVLRNKLRDEKSKAKKLFNKFCNSPEVVAALQSKTIKAEGEALKLNGLFKLSEQLGDNEVLFYPFVLPDRLELIVASSKSVPFNFPQQISQQKLTEKIFNFRQAVKGHKSDVKDLGYELYKLLIEPLEKEGFLNSGEGSSVQTIMYAPDGLLRYIPLAALHDGKDWLTRKYRVNNITALSITELNETPPEIVNVLAGAFTIDLFSVDVAGKSQTFHSLTYAHKEVEYLRTLYPSADVYLNESFSPANFVPNFEDYHLIHLATHGVFISNRPREDSFILFGNGERANISDIKNDWSLQNEVQLVVLSACETGFGGVLGNGEEIHGFGYLIQAAGADAVIASLWQVSDGGTHALMSTFYRFYKQQGVGKAEAMRQAQMALIDNSIDNDVKLTIRGVQALDDDAMTPSYEHPYFWAPFVVIGNGR